MVAMAKSGMSLREYARTRNVTLRAIQQQVESGVIVLEDGRVNPTQADDAWGPIRRTRATGAYDDAGRRSARAKIAVAMAKLRLAQERYTAARDQLVDRGEAIDVARADAEFVLAQLRAAPAERYEEFADSLGIDRQLGRVVLAEFMALAIGELGDLRRQMVRNAERA